MLRLSAIASSHRLDVDAEIAARNDAAVLERVDHVLRGLSRNGEADADAAAGRRIDGGVHADHLTLHIEGRAARVASVDRRVDLQEAVIGAVADVAAVGGDDAGGDRAAEAVGIADRDHPVADPRLLRGEGHKGVIARLIDLDHREIGLGVRGDDLGVQSLAVEHGHGDGFRVLHHVIVGDDVAVGRNEEAGAFARHHGLRVLVLGRPVVLAEPLEELLDFRRQIVPLRGNVVLVAELSTILTFTDTTAPLTRSMSGANDGMVWPADRSSRRPRRERRGNSSGRIRRTRPRRPAKRPRPKRGSSCAAPAGLRSSRKT